MSKQKVGLLGVFIFVLGSFQGGLSAVGEKPMTLKERRQASLAGMRQARKSPGTGARERAAAAERSGTKRRQVVEARPRFEKKLDLSPTREEDELDTSLNLVELEPLQQMPVLPGEQQRTVVESELKERASLEEEQRLAEMKQRVNTLIAQLFDLDFMKEARWNKSFRALLEAVNLDSKKEQEVFVNILQALSNNGSNQQLLALFNQDIGSSWSLSLTGKPFTFAEYEQSWQKTVEEFIEEQSEKLNRLLEPAVGGLPLSLSNVPAGPQPQLQQQPASPASARPQPQLQQQPASAASVAVLQQQPVSQEEVKKNEEMLIAVNNLIQDLFNQSFMEDSRYNRSFRYLLEQINKNNKASNQHFASILRILSSASTDVAKNTNLRSLFENGIGKSQPSSFLSGEFTFNEYNGDPKWKGMVAEFIKNQGNDLNVSLINEQKIVSVNALIQELYKMDFMQQAQWNKSFRYLLQEVMKESSKQESFFVDMLNILSSDDVEDEKKAKVFSIFKNSIGTSKNPLQGPFTVDNYNNDGIWKEIVDRFIKNKGDRLDLSLLKKYKLNRDQLAAAALAAAAVLPGAGAALPGAGGGD